MGDSSAELGGIVEFTALELVLLPVGLGLLGFIEPCTIGGHILFLDTQNERSRREKIRALLTFVAARSLITGLFGALVAFLGPNLIGAQTGAWLLFGVIYLIVGLALLLGKGGLIKHKVDLAPASWRRAKSPFVLGLAFGLNIPACAAPILFGLLGLAATVGTVATGFAMMFFFGLFLSSPLAVFAAVPRFAVWLQNLGARLKRNGWFVGAIFVLLGAWSIWFGIFVDPANWSGK